MGCGFHAKERGAGVEESTTTTLPPAGAQEQLDGESPDAWVDRYGNLLFRVALTRVGDRVVAEDLVQEAFLAAWKGRDQFDGRSERSTWLVAILKRKIADHFRSAGRSRETTAPGETGGDQELFDHRGVWKSPVGKLPLKLENSVEREEFWQVMETCVGELPGTLAQAFSLRELQSASPAQASDELGISRQNLSVRLHRARLLLRRCLEGRWLGERKRDK